MKKEKKDQNIGSQLKTAIKKSGKSVKYYAKLIGVSEVTIYNIFKGKNVNEDTIDKLKNALGFDDDKPQKIEVVEVKKPKKKKEKKIEKIEEEITESSFVQGEDDGDDSSRFEEWLEAAMVDETQPGDEPDSFEDENVNGEITTPVANIRSIKLSKAENDILVNSVINMANEPKQAIRFLVDSYYQFQNQRIANDNRIRAIKQGFDTTDPNNTQPSFALAWLAEENRNIEKQLKLMLAHYTVTSKVGMWLNDIVGIGPCLSAGLLAYLDVDESMHTCAGFWSYCGLNDNNVKWLGSTKAKQVMKDVHEKVLGLCKERMSRFSSLQDKKDIAQIKKLVKRYRKEFAKLFIQDAKEIDIFDILVNNYDVSEDLATKIVNDCKIYDRGYERYYNTIFYLYDTVHPTPEFMYLVAVKLKRKYRNIIKGSYDSKKAKDHTYERLEKFLSMPPYIRALKKLCYKIGDSFSKQTSRGSMYGKIYNQRREYETKKNERGDYAELAAKELEEKNYTKKEHIECLKSGKLTAGHIVMRSRRFAVKLFISHLFDAMYIDKFGRTPGLPYVFNLGNKHLDWIAPEVPYEKYWNYKDDRDYGTISREYTPNYTYHFADNPNEDNFYDEYTDRINSEDEDSDEE